MGLASSTLGTLAALTNFGLLGINAGFTRAAELESYNPSAFSVFGQILILVWGVAFYVAGKTNAAPAMWGVFAAEKFCYTAAWVHWLMADETAVHHATDMATKAIDAGDFLAAAPPLLCLTFGAVDAIYLFLFTLKALESPVDAAAEAKRRN